MIMWQSLHGLWFELDAYRIFGIALNPSGLCPYQVVGHLRHLAQEPDVIAAFRKEEAAEAYLQELIDYIESCTGVRPHFDIVKG